MLIPIDQIKLIFDQISEAAHENGNKGCATYIFCANDVDSLCALKILTVRSRLPLTLCKGYPEK